MIILVVVLSIVSFVLIQLPPGNYLDILLANMEANGFLTEDIIEETVDQLVRQYGFDLPIYGQYFKWFGNFIRGDMGRSFIYNQPVSRLIGERLALTVTVSLLTLVFTYLVAIPIGIYSATHQYSLVDYGMMGLGFIGLATPNFLLALILMFVAFKYLGWSVGGLFSPEYLTAPWSFGRVIDLIKHLPIPIIVIGTAGTAGMIRVMRATLLDELRKNYVVTARSKGLGERRLLIKYPIRVAINPMVSHIGGILPAIVSGSTITAIVISLPTVGPLLLQALLAQDMYLASSMVMFLGILGLIGTLISDLLLVVVDPRIRFERQGANA
jgi:peptide/nickel transport system permease protein